MRGSPIRGLTGVSPFKSSMIMRSQRRQMLQSSPDRLNSNLNDLEYWRIKAHQFESQLLAVSEELVLNSRRIQRVDELEEKIEMLLRQNNHLVEENETLLQVIQQKKIDNDALRHQLDAGGVALERETRRASVNINILDEEHRVHIDKLLAEITRLEDQIEEIEKLKKIEIDGIRSKYEAEAIQQIQNLRRSQQGNNELLELNIRNLKDTIQEKNLEIERLKKEFKLDGERAAGESAFLRNEIKKIQQQKLNEFELYQAEHENNINNLNRTNKKNEEDIKNLYENKIRRLGYEIEEKKNEIEENLGRFRRSGKESEQEIALLIEDKSQLRKELKDLDTLRLRQLEDLTNFYDNEITNLKANAEAKEVNSNKLLEDQVERLRKIIEAKQVQNTSLMNQIRVIKENQNVKITNLQNEKDELERKLKEMILHYEREIELLKIKTAKLYESDLEALKRQLENQLSLLASENGKLKESLKQARDHLVNELEEKVLMRRDYETRLRQMNIKYEREHQQLNQLILMAEKNFQNAHSATSLRDIEHSAKTKKQHTSFEEKIAEKRNLQSQIVNKNKEIQALNLRIQKMQGYHEKQIADLEKRHAEDTDKFKESLNTQNALLKAQVEHQEDLEKKYKDLQEKLRAKQKEWNDKLNAKSKQLEAKGIRIANLEGKILELEKHHGVLESYIKVQKGNIDQTNLDMTSLMNQEKERLEGIRESDKEGIRRDYENRMNLLKKEIADLNNLIENLRAAYEAEKVKSRALEKELNDNLKKLDDKGILEEHVINIGLSNNYFKNVAEIFRKEL